MKFELETAMGEMAIVDIQGEWVRVKMDDDLVEVTFQFTKEEALQLAAALVSAAKEVE